ncbi:fibrinogen-like protein 1 [Drosophila montana]|uniref:fibrinogen-like protein 1 n=1 Tax=Drosophila montana TaxID=40370 RepID=UPI00313DBABF
MMQFPFVVLLTFLSYTLADKEELCDSEIEAWKSQIDILEADIEEHEEKLQILTSEMNIQLKSIDFSLVANNSAEIEHQLQLEEKENYFKSFLNCDSRQISHNWLHYLRFKGTYEFKLPDWTIFSAFYDSDWTVIQRRTCQHLNTGSGHPDSEFFIGLDKFYAMIASQPHELLIYFQYYHNHIGYAYYKNFSIGNEQEDYKLISLGQYSGNLLTYLEKCVGLRSGNSATGQPGNWATGDSRVETPLDDVDNAPTSIGVAKAIRQQQQQQQQQ